MIQAFWQMYLLTPYCAITRVPWRVRIVLAVPTSRFLEKALSVGTADASSPHTGKLLIGPDPG
jgi:hypothetical protein